MPQQAVVFGSRLSPFVEKVVRALSVKGIAFRLEEPRSPRDFARWNPQTRKMPAVTLDGQHLYDSTFIIRRLDELVPAPPLVSPDGLTAANQRLLEDWADESLYWYGMALRWSPKNKAASARQILAGLPPAIRAIALLVLPRQIRATTIAQGLGRLPHDVLVRELAGHLDSLVTILGSRPFFHADQPSVADLAIFGQLRMLGSGPTPEAAALVQDRSALVAHVRRVEDVAKAA
jgi:glutathione S-transferase